MKIIYFGSKSNYTHALEKLSASISYFSRSSHNKTDLVHEDFNTICYRLLPFLQTNQYLIFGVGHLMNQSLLEQTSDESSTSWLLNCFMPCKLAEYALTINKNIQILFITSESAFKGSYDLSYAMAKSGVELYVKQRLTLPSQRLLAIAPSTITDLPMTIRRSDYDRLDEYKQAHPMQRFIYSNELAELTLNILNCPLYLRNCIIPFNGGKFAQARYWV